MECRWVPIIQYISLFKRLHYPRSFRRTTVNLSFKILGDNPTDPDLPPILLLHGLLGNKKHWEGLGKTILNLTRRSVVAVDLRNHGDSPHTASHSYEELAEDVLFLYKKLGIGKASIIGDISPVSTSAQLTDFFPKIMSAMKEVDFKGITIIREARKNAKLHLRKIIDDDVTMRVVLSNINKHENGTIRWTCNLDTLIKSFDNIASFPISMEDKKYPGPALFIGGQLSEFIPADDLPGIREMFPQAVVTYVPKAGHNVHADDPKAFLEYTIAFIKTND